MQIGCYTAGVNETLAQGRGLLVPEHHGSLPRCTLFERNEIVPHTIHEHNDNYGVLSDGHVVACRLPLLHMCWLNGTRGQLGKGFWCA
jgi:hypothetical protein